jgi:DNA-binding NarL/FixJ family response regulator
MIKIYELTEREQEVLDLIVNNVKGEELKDLAKKLHITRSTFITHLNSIYFKKNAHSQIELIIGYYKEKLENATKNNNG